MRIGAIATLYRYAVKSMGGESLESVEIGEKGIPGDRCWAVRDEVKGGIRGAKQIPGLMELSARLSAPASPGGSSPAEILFPDASVASTGDADIAQRISAAVGREISLWPLLAADDLEHYRRGAPTHTDMDTELRAIFAREPDEPLPDLSVFPPELREFESPPGTYFDAFPLLVLSEASLASMQKRAPDSVFDVRRFRPNLVISESDPAQPFPEAGWAGRRVRIGSVVLQMGVECPRCVMTTRGFDDLPKDPSIMRSLVQENGGQLGVYATVSEPGTVRVGDSCEVLEE